MSTTTCSIRVNTNSKRVFDRVCEQMGLTPSAAYNLFTNAVATERRIPFEIKARPLRDETEPEVDILADARADLEQRGLLRDYTQDEINELITEAHQTEISKEDKEFLDELFQDK